MTTNQLTFSSFLTSLGRIARPDWLPTDDDILVGRSEHVPRTESKTGSAPQNVRVRTLGIEQHFLQITPTQIYRICDVAGARGVKHSWACATHHLCARTVP